MQENHRDVTGHRGSPDDWLGDYNHCIRKGREASRLDGLKNGASRRVLGLQLGEKHGRAKLRDEDIPVIRQALSDGNSIGWLAQVFEISPTTIWEIKAGLNRMGAGPRP